jgi:DNA-binding transcriptional regulator LsrR (DeoR family)
MNNIKNTHNDSLMQEKILLISELYYIYKLSQQEISKKLGVSRPWVSKLLKRAEEIGVVRIEVLSPSAGIVDLEDQIKKKFNIANAKVVQTLSQDRVIQNIGKAAANYTLSIIKPKDVIGVSWGRSLSAVAEQFVPMHYPEMSVTPILGGLEINPELLSNQIAAKIAETLGANSWILHAPAFTSGESERDIFLKEPSIDNVIKNCEKVDIVITGLGSLRGSTIDQAGYITSQEVDELEALGAVGDIALRFVDVDGNVVSHNIHNRLVACDLSILRKCSRQIIGVASGEDKVEIIRAALKGNWLDAIITDVSAAEKLLEL